MPFQLVKQGWHLNTTGVLSFPLVHVHLSAQRVPVLVSAQNLKAT
jgi:hypothetical protein